MSTKKIIKTPLRADELEALKPGEIFYLSGLIVTCGDAAHRRLSEQKNDLPVDLHGLAVFHAGPLVDQNENGKYRIVSIGSTTSMRMEKYEKDFIERTGTRLIIGKGGMGSSTEQACREFGAVHAVFPSECGAVGASQISEIIRCEWLDLGMSEALWLCRAREFGPLIVSIDTRGNNLFAQNKKLFQQRKEKVASEICRQVNFMK